MPLFPAYFSLISLLIYLGREGGGSATGGGGDDGMAQKELDLHYYTEQAIIAAKTQVSFCQHIIALLYIITYINIIQL